MDTLASYHNILSYLVRNAMQFRYTVSPNPTVGAGLLHNNTLVAEGYHTHFGAEHAEIACINMACKKGIPLTECTLIVTLEPCTHTGKTPPCVERILAEQIPKVVIGAKECTQNASGGIAFLRKHGVEVKYIDDTTSQYCIQNFTAWNVHKIPHVILKLASTIDGYIATCTGESKWISNEVSRRFVQELRANIAMCNGAILVGANTVRYDNPKLLVKDIPSDTHPRPIIISNTLEGLCSSYLVKERAKECIIITSYEAMESAEALKLNTYGVLCIPVSSIITTNGENNRTNLNIREALQILYTQHNILYVLCEGGGNLAYSLLAENIPLEIYHFTAPKIFADRSATPLIYGANTPNLTEAFTYTLQSVQVLENDILSIYSSV